MDFPQRITFAATYINHYYYPLYMKNAALVLSSLALIGVLVLLGLRLSDNKKAGAGSTGSTVAAPTGNGFHLAYVNIDTFEANYTMLKSKREDFSKRQTAMQQELQSSAAQMQQQAADFQSKASTMTQAEGEAAQKRIAQMRESLETRSQTMQDQLMKEQDVFNADLHKRLDNFLETYNKDKHYDLIISYQSGSPFLYVNKAMDITPDVIKGMNNATAPAATDAK